MVGERLVEGEYTRLELNHEDDGRLWAHSDALNLDVWWIEGELRFWDIATSNWLLNYEEEQVARLAAQAQAQAERAGRLAAEARLAEMEAELLRLRGE